MPSSYSYSGQRVLVTGAAGFVGSHLVPTLSSQGADVAVLVRGEAKANASFVGDLRDAKFVDEAMSTWQPDVVFHLAAKRLRSLDTTYMREAIDVNVGGTLNLLSAAGKLSRQPRVVSLGTGEEYGDAPSPYREDQRELPVTGYSLTKLSATQLCQMLARTSGLAVCVVRPSVVYGPGQGVDMFLPALTRALLRRERFAMTAGEQTRDYAFVGDLVEALLRAGTADMVAGEVINIGSGVATRIATLADIVEAMTGAVGYTDRGAVSYRPAELMTYSMDITKAERLLGWRPTTTLERGLEQTIAWYRVN